MLREWAERVSEHQLVVLGRRRARIQQGEKLNKKCSLCQCKFLKVCIMRPTRDSMQLKLLWLHREMWIIHYLPSLPPNTMCNRRIPCHLLVIFKQKPKADHYQQFLGRKSVPASARKQYTLYLHTYPQCFIIFLRYVINWSPWLWNLYCTWNAQLTAHSEGFLLCIIIFHNARSTNLLSYICLAPVAAAFTGHCSFWLLSEPVQSVKCEEH